MAGRRVHLVRRDLIFAAVREAGRISRADLGRRTGMARMTVTGLVDELLAAGLLAEGEAVADGTRAGRPARLVTLGPAAGVVVGALIGGDGVRVAVADLAGAIRFERHVPADPADADAGLDVLTALVAEATGEERIWSVVLGLSAPISGGTVQPSSVLTGWAGRVPARELQSRLGQRVTVRNGADLCVLGEAAFGVAAGHQDVCYLRISTGIGCGLMLGGHVHAGSTGVAGEIGHVQVDETGVLCSCGNRGCLETIAAPRQIIAALEQTYGERLTVTGALDLARRDATAERVLADAGRMIGRVLGDLANTVNPGLIVLDGPLIEADGAILGGVREAMRRYAQPEVVDSTEVLVSGLAGRAGLLGAVTAALRTTPAERGSRALLKADKSEKSLSKKERDVRRDMITELLRSHGPTARADIVKHTRLPRAAVADLLAGLTRDRVVEPCPPPETRPGRPSPHFRMAAPAGVILGMTLELDGVHAILADRAGNRLGDAFHPLVPSTDGRALIRATAEFARGLLADHREDARVALSVPSPVHPVTGRFGTRSVLPMFSGFSAAAEMTEILGCPVTAFNNAQLSALAEARRGAARGVREVLYLKAEAHLGAGIVAGGRSYGGAIGYAGEIGHLNVREIGPLCVCGSRGCLSAFLLPAHFGAVLDRGGPPTEEGLLSMAAEGHRPAQRALLDAGRLIGRTVAVLCDVLNPAVVVVGGRFTEPGPYVMEGVSEALRRHCAPSATAGLTVVRAALGAEAEALGAVESLL
ncbi:ROK family transcriptional regulator [Actinoplanes sp. NPDC051851]|uniref:ROK family transcriptional regulator n=1 Tax=Actinoplanes sp. NPDC051851 TaxID=3154753 RepID=UPI00341D060B